MAVISKSIQSEINLTVFTVFGDTTFEEIMDQTRLFFNNIPAKLVLWDFSEGTVAHITSQEIDKIASDGPCSHPKIQNGKCAILASEAVDFGIGRMFQIISEMRGFPYSVEIFRDKETARKWLLSD